ncbi:MAG: T9SS type A sorting domain-containing protein [Candidatus Symbiothrix sp.]|nr:T9SS type A sorting domain-containing protein [Candidatus Symbiothrix sp.]
MKKLFTILLSSLFITNLLGQVPVAVLGDVYVAGGGKMLSEGPVHVRATATANGRINNEASATLSFKDSLILYSNNDRDGLLLNKGAKTAITIGGPVLVRKLFTGYDDGGWHPVSFPFDVEFNNVYQPNGDPAYLGRDYPTTAHYWVSEFDTVNRANEGLTTENWIWLPNTTAKLNKGIGYRITRDVLYGGAVDQELDFVIKTADVDTLFNNTVAFKSKKLSYADGKGGLDEWIGNRGWNIIGGLNASSFLLDKDNVGAYTGIIYYWNTVANHYEDILINPISTEFAILSPYVPFYVQTDGLGKFFEFKTTGLTLDNGTTGFRSIEQVEDATSDVLYLAVSDNKNNFGRIYLMLSDTYDENFKPGEDALKLATTHPLSPVLWSLHTENGKITPLVLNSLPRVNGTRELKLGLSVPAAGEYTFDLRDLVNNKVRSALLLDKETNKQTELLASPYSFRTSGSALLENRFVLYINKVSTAIDQPGIPETAVYAYTNNNVLTVKNLLVGNKVQVSDLTGRSIATGVTTGSEFSVLLVQKGVYIVNVIGEKATVLKVLNK